MAQTSTTRLASEAWEALARAQATIQGELIAGELWGELMPREYGALYELSKAPEGLRITELGEDVLLTQPGMSRLASRLESRGLVSRADDPEDARACRIMLTEAGAKLQRQLGLAHARQLREAMTHDLGRRELRQLRDLCERLVSQPDRREKHQASRRRAPLRAI